ncbi:MAG: polysaccharide export protein [Elusimicrobia bacterium]|nr:polysaccharide export protein [Elusimicrobiota bacterium]
MKTISLLMSLVLFTGQLPAFCLDAAAPEKEYPISAGDVINISVFPAQEFSREVTVQPDGSVEIPLLGSVDAAGMKTDELQKVLTAKFSKYVSNPSITLSVRKFSFQRVAVIGEIKGAGYYEYREGMRLLDLVAQAGGLQDYARGAKVRIYRKSKDGAKTTELVISADLDKVLSGDLDKNVALESGDIVYIPRKPYSSAARWITDNVIPWATLFIFMITAGIVAKKNR